MKRILLACLCMGVMKMAASAPAMEVHNIAQDFVTFWDATQSMPLDERVQAFKQQVGVKFPGFYGVARYEGKRTDSQQDYVIGQALERFGPRRQAYIDKVVEFNAALPRHTATFLRTFPDFRPTVEVWFLNSLGEMDGGTREFGGKNYLIFGADLMVVLHGGNNEAPFFHHELFHVRHDAVSPECAGQGMWQPLWREGLATYVSKVMNPGANDKELLLDFPAGTLSITKARLTQSFSDIEKVLDNPDDRYYGPLFGTEQDGTGLAPRRGYYLGYLVAQEIGRTRDLAALTLLNCADARQLVLNAVAKLSRQ